MKPPELVCVAPAEIRHLWPHVEPLLKAAISRTGLSAFQDIEDDVLFGNALVWLAWNGETIEAAASTALQKTDDGLVCLITACGGSDMKRWLPLLEKIEQFAKAEGCKRTRIIGRKGWLNVLNGYEEKAVIMDREL